MKHVNRTWNRYTICFWADDDDEPARKRLPISRRRYFCLWTKFHAAMAMSPSWRGTGSGAFLAVVSPLSTHWAILESSNVQQCRKSTSFLGRETRRWYCLHSQMTLLVEAASELRDISFDVEIAWNIICRNMPSGAMIYKACCLQFYAFPKVLNFTHSALYDSGF